MDQTMQDERGTNATAEPGVAIIGYGAAGVNALMALRTAGYTGPVRVFSNTGTLPYSPILTSYYAGGRKAYEECFPWSAAELDELDAEVLANTPVLELDPAAHAILTEAGTFAYTKCVIATGSTPMCYGFPGVEGEPDFKPLVLRTMEDAERLKATLADPACRRVLVSGASMVALKTLEACLDRGKDVALVGMNPHVLDFNALPETAERFERGLRAKGVALHLGQTVASVRRLDSGRLEVAFSTGETDVFDAIAVAHGMKSNLDFVKEGALEMDRALVVDEFMRTSDPDVYAAGDVAQALELISGEKRIVGIWKNAAVQGACAGRAIAAELAGREPDAADAYRGSISTNTIAVDGTLFISAGTMELGDGRHVEVREGGDMTVAYVLEEASGPGGAGPVAAGGEGCAAGAAERLVGFSLTCDVDEPGGVAYDTGAMLSLRIEAACR